VGQVVDHLLSYSLVSKLNVEAATGLLRWAWRYYGVAPKTHQRAYQEGQSGHGYGLEHFLFSLANARFIAALSKSLEYVDLVTPAFFASMLSIFASFASSRTPRC